MGMSMYAILSTGAARVVIGVGVLQRRARFCFSSVKACLVGAFLHPIGLNLAGGTAISGRAHGYERVAAVTLDGRGSCLLALWIAKQIVMSSSCHPGGLPG